jgi:hypothetical protein
MLGQVRRGKGHTPRCLQEWQKVAGAAAGFDGVTCAHQETDTGSVKLQRLLQLVLLPEGMAWTCPHVHCTREFAVPQPTAASYGFVLCW